MPKRKISLRRHLEALRVLDKELADERDRRYREVSEEKEKALKIKDTADRDALSLSRDSQTYKDEKANELRSQIERERITYATKDDLASISDKLESQIKPIGDFVTGQLGRSSGNTERRLDTGQTFQILAFLVMAAGVVFAIIHG